MAKQSRRTRQKLVIEDEIMKSGSFLTIDDILRRANTKDSRIGIATVYRHLKRLKDSGKVHSYICNKKKVYSSHKNNHCHFSCQKCGRVMHFEIGSLDFAKKSFKGTVCHFQVDITGICVECLKP